MSTITLKPGLLVSLKTTIIGGVTYTRVDLDPERKQEDGSATARWETTKVVANVAALKAAVKVRGKASSLVRGVCVRSDFGLLCPTSGETKLGEAIQKARGLVSIYNQEETGIRVSIYVLKGRIAESDAEATRAIGMEFRGLLGEMQDGIATLDVAKVREAASKAKRLGAMLDDSLKGKIAGAVVEAREAAKQIVKQLTAGVDKAAIEVEATNLKALQEARFAFLDLEEPNGAPPPATIIPAREVEVA